MINTLSLSAQYTKLTESSIILCFKTLNIAKLISEIDWERRWNSKWSEAFSYAGAGNRFNITSTRFRFCCGLCVALWLAGGKDGHETIPKESLSTIDFSEHTLSTLSVVHYLHKRHSELVMPLSRSLFNLERNGIAQKLREKYAVKPPKHQLAEQRLFN